MILHFSLANAANAATEDPMFPVDAITTLFRPQVTAFVISSDEPRSLNDPGEIANWHECPVFPVTRALAHEFVLANRTLYRCVVILSVKRRIALRTPHDRASPDLLRGIGTFASDASKKFGSVLNFMTRP